MQGEARGLDGKCLGWELSERNVSSVFVSTQQLAGHSAECPARTEENINFMMAGRNYTAFAININMAEEKVEECRALLQLL